MTLERFPESQPGLGKGVGKSGVPKVILGMGTCGLAAGALDVYEALDSRIKEARLDVALEKVGCIGMCEQEVLLDVVLPGAPRITYGRVTPDMAVKILEEHVLGNTPITEWVVGKILDEARPYEGVGFFSKQRRIVLTRCGFIDPENLDDYLSHGGYGALTRVLKEMTPDQIIDAVKTSGLRGRGGAGFPTGLKWFFTRQAPGDKKYVVCNGDEGDPGAFMDRAVLEGDPFSVIEGMTIAGYAIGADEGYMYVRAEYPLAVKRLLLAFDKARDRGLLGKNILGTGFSFDLNLKEGAGAFVCGEETALLASIEGERGMPRSRPPFPANKGLWGKPTNINNVETYANIPWIIQMGPLEYSSLGTPRSKGTKVFSLTGKIKNTGLAEVPMGITLREIIYDIGGGIKDDRRLKGVQIGGPSGGCLPEDLLDTPVDYDSLTAAGAMMGSGGLVVLDDKTCMVDLARFFLTFTQTESCGKCTPCREGTKRMLEILTKICGGEGTPDDLDRLEDLARVVKDTALCGLGQTAPNPVLTTIRYFRHEYEEHIRDKRCRAGVCKKLLSYRIVAELCKSCGKCKRVCPSSAIEGDRKTPYRIDDSKCIRCGSCIEQCNFNAIVLGGE